MCSGVHLRMECGLPKNPESRWLTDWMRTCEIAQACLSCLAASGRFCTNWLPAHFACQLRFGCQPLFFCTKIPGGLVEVYGSATEVHGGTSWPQTAVQMGDIAIISKCCCYLWVRASSLVLSCGCCSYQLASYLCICVFVHLWCCH